MKFVGVNGINTHGAGTTDVMLNELRARGYQVADVQLPKINAWRARSERGAHGDAHLIMEVAEPGDILICHSFGCLRGAWAMKEMDFTHVYMSRPAMARDYQFKNPEKVTCLYSSWDLAILLGGWLQFKHPFGHAGLRGFTQDGVRNWKFHGRHSVDFHKGLARFTRFIEQDVAKLGISQDLSVARAG